jgi:hypothetical protein
MRILRTLAVVGLVSTLSACDAYEPPAAPTIPTSPGASTLPARLVLAVSSRLDDRLDVGANVISADGHTLPNVLVTFSIEAGTVTPATAMTDATGVARAVAVSTAMTTISATADNGVAASVFVLSSTQ